MTGLLNLQSSAYQTRSVLHCSHTHAGSSPGSSVRLATDKSTAVVADLQHNTIVFVHQQYLDVVSRTVSQRIGDSFLRDAI